MGGHSRGGLSLGRGFPIVSSNKQKISTRSSTETEIFGAGDFMTEICWTQYFTEAHCYVVKDNVLFQDNIRSILLELNGKASSIKRMKHINIPYFFITDRVSMEEVLVVWCPTGDMIGDYVIKPLQGALFRKFRDQIMGVTPARDPAQGKTDSSVGKTETSKTKSCQGKKAAPHECVGSRTQDCVKLEPRLVKEIADTAIFNHSSGKSVSYSHADCAGQEKHLNSISLLHLTS
jgi:hypothetical protein